MRIRKTAEERAAELEARRKMEAWRLEAEDRELAPIWRELDAAKHAYAAGDVKAEEEAIQRGARLAERVAAKALRRQATARYNEALIDATKKREIRRGAYIGRVGAIHMWEDRILAADKSVYLMDARVHATVDTAGNISVSRRPTLGRMAAGAILPGSALIPGLATAKKETFDTRELYFLLEHPEWGGVAISVNPDLGQVVRSIAVKVNSAAASFAEKPPADRPDDDPISRLERLVALRDAGALTDDEFTKAKAQILES